MSVNSALIMQVIESIREDDTFSMSKWENCICGHILRAAKLEVPSCDYMSALRAINLDPKVASDEGLFRNDDHKTKESIMAQLYHLAETGQLREIPRPEYDNGSSIRIVELIQEPADSVPSTVG